MAKTLEIHGVSDALYQAITERAEQAGLSVSAYVLRELVRIHRIPRADLGKFQVADLIREGREERTDQILDSISATLRELEARRGTLSNEEVFALLRRLPRRPASLTSADIIREHRGPLPEDDPDFVDLQ
jgi:hypothetical protein